MLKQPSSQGVFTKEKRNTLVAIAVLSAILFLVKEFFIKHEPPVPNNRVIITILNGEDSIQIDCTDWDSTQIDSFVKTRFRQPSKEDDSLYKAYGLDELDSLMINTPSSPLLDSLLKEVM